MSVGTATTSAPVATSSFAACSSTGRSMSASTTRMPSAANRSAEGAPDARRGPGDDRDLAGEVVPRSGAQEVGRVEQLGVFLAAPWPCRCSGCGRPRGRSAALASPSATCANCSMSSTAHAGLGHRRERGHEALDDERGEAERELVDEQHRRAATPAPARAPPSAAGRPTDERPWCLPASLQLGEQLERVRRCRSRPRRGRASTWRRAGCRRRSARAGAVGLRARRRRPPGGSSRAGAW